MSEPVQPCLLCGGAPGRPAFPFETTWEGRLYCYFDCSACRCTFVSPVPPPERLAALFAPGDYHDRFYRDVEPTTAEIDALDEAAPYLRRGGRLLDYGCGNGSFLVAARARGYRCDGAELDERWRRKVAERTGAEILAPDALLRSGRRYDAVRLADVLSHLAAPAATLTMLKGLLTADGVLMIEGPLEKQRNPVRLATLAAASLRHVRRRSVESGHAPYHLTFTDWHSQRRFFERIAGLEIVSASLSDTGWPYSSSEGRSAPARLRRAVGRFSVLFSRSAVGCRIGSANRFRTILRPGSEGCRS